MAKPLSSKQYASESGDTCPNCRNNSNLSYGEFECEDGWAWREVWCDGCDGHWVEDYKLVGYEMKED